MSTGTENAGQAPLRGVQAPHGHAGVRAVNAASASSMLRADQVAAIDVLAARWLLSSFETPATRQLAFELLSHGLPALAAQDGRWRALVGELVKYTWHWPMCESDDGCTCGYRALNAQAQAALAGGSTSMQDTPEHGG